MGLFRLLGINGSLRRQSYNGMALELVGNIMSASIEFSAWFKK